MKGPLVAAAQALGAILLWSLGGGFAARIWACGGDWLTCAALIVTCVALQSAGLWLFTSYRDKEGYRRGYREGRASAFREGDSMMRDFLTERAVFMVGPMPQRPEKPAEEKAN